MDIKEFAQMLDGRQYGYPQFTEEELRIAEENGFVIVYGASDDLMEFAGAIEDEGGCFDGGEVWFSRDGVIDVPFSEGSRCIEAVWGYDDMDWSYRTDIPHEEFMIYEDQDLYCQAIVFKLEDM